jgi:hypothetical protein
LNPPRPDKAANVDGSFTITVTWKVPCPEGHGDGLCKYTVTLTVFLDNAGAVTGASATGS